MSTLKITDEQKSYCGDALKSLRTKYGYTIQQLAKDTGLSKQTLWRYEKGRTAPEGLQLARLKDFFNGLLIPRETSGAVADPGPDDSGPDHGLSAAKIRAAELLRKGGDPLGVVPPELSRAELAVMEFSAWARRTVLKAPEQIDELEPAMRRLMNEVENGRLIALKMDVVAHPEAWGDNLRELVKALPAFERRRLLDWLADQTSDGAERKPDPDRKSAAVGGGDK